MSGYCSLPEKYWTHHHSPSPVVPSNNSRHSSVYPQVFYTPPPPPPPNYSVSTGAQVSGVSGSVPPPPDWSCPPPNPDSYSHLLYSQYPSQHDYSNFLPIPTSCYDTDILIMGGVGSGPPPPTALHGPASGGSYESAHTTSQSMSNSFMYLPPPPPPLSTFEGLLNSTPISTSNLVEKPGKILSPPSPPVPSSSSDDSSNDFDDDEDNERHVISIEDDNTSGESEASSSEDLPRCVLCKKSVVLPLITPTAPSPQLSKILENIDDSELDISVCSGDIEIGGIEDEMIQQVAEDQHQLSSCKITLARLAQLVEVPLTSFFTAAEEYTKYSQESVQNQLAVLCSKCLKFVNLAESLEKQLTSVLETLRQVVVPNTKEHDQRFPPVSAVSTQTDFSHDFIGRPESTENRQPFHNITIYRNNYSSHPQIAADLHQSITMGSSVSVSDKSGENTDSLASFESSTKVFLCHHCGRCFNCGRNLGKHIKRHHSDENTLSEVSCERTNCERVFPDKTALQVHMRSHTGNKPYFCRNCLKLFTTKSNLTAHFELCTKKSDSNDINDRMTNASSDQNFPASNNASFEKRRFHCQECGLTFRTKARQEKHDKSGCSRSKIFKCETCSKVFVKRSELHAHLVVHTGVKSFLCDICGLAFTTKGNQRVHQRTHFSQKRFKCRQCEKGFTRNFTLQQHIANAHNTNQN